MASTSLDLHVLFVSQIILPNHDISEKKLHTKCFVSSFVSKLNRLLTNGKQSGKFYDSIYPKWSRHDKPSRYSVPKKDFFCVKHAHLDFNPKLSREPTRQIRYVEKNREEIKVDSHAKDHRLIAKSLIQIQAPNLDRRDSAFRTFHAIYSSKNVYRGKCVLTTMLNESNSKHFSSRMIGETESNKSSSCLVAAVSAKNPSALATLKPTGIEVSESPDKTALKHMPMKTNENSGTHKKPSDPSFQSNENDFADGEQSVVPNLEYRTTRTRSAKLIEFFGGRLYTVVDNIKMAFRQLEKIRFRIEEKLPSSRYRTARTLILEICLIFFLTYLLRYGVSRALRRIHEYMKINSHALRIQIPKRYEDTVFYSMQHPFEFLSVFVVGTFFIENLARATAAVGLLNSIDIMRNLGIVFVLSWFFLNWIEVIRNRLTFAVENGYVRAPNPPSPVQIDAVSRGGKIVTTALAIIVSCDAIGLNVKTVVAFSGIGGVAIGFAGKEVISNFFGGLMIFLTRPFTKGEWVRAINNDALEGMVEEVGWYMTRIRGWDKRPMYVPNSLFATMVIQTPSRMTNRRILHWLHLRLEDGPKAKDICKDISSYLMTHPGLDPKQHKQCYAEAFTDFSLKIYISCFTRTIFYEDFLTTNQDIILKAQSIIRQYGARLASRVDGVQVSVDKADTLPGALPGIQVNVDTNLASINDQDSETSEDEKPREEGERKRLNIVPGPTSNTVLSSEPNTTGTFVVVEESKPVDETVRVIRSKPNKAGKTGATEDSILGNSSQTEQ